MAIAFAGSATGVDGFAGGATAGTAHAHPIATKAGLTGSNWIFLVTYDIKTGGTGGPWSTSFTPPTLTVGGVPVPLTYVAAGTYWGKYSGTLAGQSAIAQFDYSETGKTIVAAPGEPGEIYPIDDVSAIVQVACWSDARQVAPTFSAAPFINNAVMRVQSVGANAPNSMLVCVGYTTYQDPTAWTLQVSNPVQVNHSTFNNAQPAGGVATVLTTTAATAGNNTQYLGFTNTGSGYLMAVEIQQVPSNSAGLVISESGFYRVAIEYKPSAGANITVTQIEASRQVNGVDNTLPVALAITNGTLYASGITVLKTEGICSLTAGDIIRLRIVNGAAGTLNGTLKLIVERVS